MIKERAQFISRLIIISDAILMFINIKIAIVIRETFFLAYFPSLIKNIDPTANYEYIFIPLIPLNIIFYRFFRVYRSLRLTSYHKLIWVIVRANVLSVFCVALFVFSFKIIHFPRSLLIIFFLLNTFVFVVYRIIVKYQLARFRSKGYNLRNVLIIGTGENAKEFSDKITQNIAWGFHIIGFVDLPKQKKNLENSKTLNLIKKKRILGSIKNLDTILKQKVVDEIFIAESFDQIPNFSSFIQNLESKGLTVRMSLGPLFVQNFKANVQNFLETPVLVYHSINLNYTQQVCKTILDYFFGIIGFSIFLFLFPFMYIYIQIVSPGPVLFSQIRYGQNNRKFKIYKFRTMVLNAEKKLKQLKKKNEMKGAIFKMKNDPRIIFGGKMIRRLSLDEFPQFLNILKGEMSLVGTRPPTEEEVKAYQGWQKRRFSIKPGLTGLWQVSGRNKVSDFDKIVKLDLKYIDEWSISKDISIILKTLLILFTNKIG